MGENETGSTNRGQKVWEIATAADWVALVEKYPLPASPIASRAWLDILGLADAAGAPHLADADTTWYRPDWAGFGRDYKAIHVSVAGYMAANYEPLPVLPGHTVPAGYTMQTGYTVLAGWEPGATVWFPA